MGACAMMISAASCSQKSNNEYIDEATGQPREYSLEGEAPTRLEKALGDSFSLILGKDMGGHWKSQFEYQIKNNPDAPAPNIEKFIKGMESVLYADTTDNLSYLMGQNFALQQIVNVELQLRSSNIPFNAKLLVKGFREAYNDTVVRMYQSNLRDIQTQIRALEAKKDSVVLSIKKVENEKAGKAYLDSVKNSDPSVLTTESGLSYKILAPGSEKMVNLDGKVKLNYKGTKTNGEVFDETNGQPREFPAGGFIPGFVEGISMLGEGGKAVLYIPGNIAYGERGVPQINIGPDEMLIFEVEIIEVIEPEAEASK